MPSIGSLRQAKKIYLFIVGDYHKYPTEDLKELASYIDGIKKQARRKKKG